MRKIDVAYNPPLPETGEIKKSIENMDVDELQKLIKESCLKCRGDFTVCESCKGCLEGRLIIDKLRGKPMHNVDAILGMKNLSPAVKQDIAKKLYHDALMSDDPVAYLMKECGVDEKRAKHRLATYKTKYGYVREKVAFEKAYPDKFKDGKAILEPKKMVEIVPKKEQTVKELIMKLENEKNELTKQMERIEDRISEIIQTLNVIRSVAG